MGSFQQSLPRFLKVDPAFGLRSAFHHEPCHFGSKIIISSDVTVTVRIRFSSFFLQKLIMSTLEICLAKSEVIPTNRSRVPSLDLPSAF